MDQIMRIKLILACLGHLNRSVLVQFVCADVVLM